MSPKEHEELSQLVATWRRTARASEPEDLVNGQVMLDLCAVELETYLSQHKPEGEAP